MAFPKALLFLPFCLLMTWCQENATEKLSVDLCDTCSCYEMYHWDHTFCTSPDSSVCGTVFARNVEDEDKVTIVNLHNRLRSKIARGEEITFETYPAASNMMQLEWDDSLADVAQRWAEQCQFEHDCVFCRHDPRFVVGQNVCWLPGSGTFDWATCIFYWYYEIKLFYPELIDMFWEAESGHFTMMSWANSWKIGCGATMSVIGRVMVCNYGPGGNILDEKVYEPGETCSGCPRNTCCNCTQRIREQDDRYIVYGGLCQAKDEYGPQMDLPVPDANVIMWCNFSSDNCSIATEGTGSLKEMRTTDRVYYRISLGPFQRFKVQFPQELILYDHAVEFQFDFRKGPVTSSFPGEQLLVLAVQYYGYPDYGVASPIIEDRAIWETTKLSLSGWPPKATLVIEFSNDAWVPQFFDLTNILVRIVD